ncbi:MAG: hypothetical protein FJ387_27745 [Verrucomicrobia bacterium]|nr:hypothetical protein [Verrucomicrobiota bacterium]
MHRLCLYLSTLRPTLPRHTPAPPPPSRGWQTRRAWSLGGWLVGLCLWGATSDRAAQAGNGVIQQINLVHFTHTDFGFTDHPAVTRDMQRRYLDIALDTIQATAHQPDDAKFRWTAETLVAVDDWWRTASAARRGAFLEAVRVGHLDLGALPLNQTPFLDAAQWRTMLDWIPEELWQETRPRVAIQNDVNGFPRAGALALLDRGVRWLFMGINEDSGGTPFRRPSAFWWKMPDGRRLFVWLNAHYGSGYEFFEAEEWRRGPVPYAADTRFRPPRAGDLVRTDEASLRAAHRRCLARVQQLEQNGYAHPILTTSITSMWRMDNDPPFPPLAAFVAAWTRLGLEPKLKLTTASAAMADMERLLGEAAPEHAGEWTDWWANGTASAPREVAASRLAKRWLAAAQSPMWGPLADTACHTVDALYRELCLFDEHTWGSSWSVARPYSLDSQAQFNEKAGLAFRPMAQAEWLLAQRVRSRLGREGEGLWLANSAPAAYSGWVHLPVTALRSPYRSVEDPAQGQHLPLHFAPGWQAWGRPRTPADLSPEAESATFPDRSPNQVAKFWVEQLAGGEIRRLRLNTGATPAEAAASTAPPLVQVDERGWPLLAQWPGMKRPLFMPGSGDLLSVQANAFAPRWVLHDIMSQRDDERRERMRRETLVETWAVPAARTDVEETPHTLRFVQALEHPRLKWATRELELWKRAPRARLTLRMHRLPSTAPAILYAVFPLPLDGIPPRTSCGGLAFAPYTDQLPNTCRDYFGIDGWVDYTSADGHWLWVSRDAPLITFGGQQAVARRQSAPADTHRLLSMLLNNFWYTNFAADSHGLLEFQFHLEWSPQDLAPAAVAQRAAALLSEPLVLLNPALPEDPALLDRLYAP